MQTITLIAVILLAIAIILWCLAQYFILKRIKKVSESIKSQRSFRDKMHEEKNPLEIGRAHV